MGGGFLLECSIAVDQIDKRVSILSSVGQKEHFKLDAVSSAGPLGEV